MLSSNKKSVGLAFNKMKARDQALFRQSENTQDYDYISAKDKLIANLSSGYCKFSMYEKTNRTRLAQNNPLLTDDIDYNKMFYSQKGTRSHIKWNKQLARDERLY